MSNSNRQLPSSWTAYERGGRQGSDSGLSVTFEEEEGQRHASFDQRHLGVPQNAEQQQQLRRRRSSLAERVHALRSVGGVNSLDNFARSFARSVGFVEVTPVRHSFRYVDDRDEEEHTDSREAAGVSPMAQRSLLRQQIADREHVSPAEVVEDDGDEDDDTDDAPTVRERGPSIREETPLLRERSSHAHDPNIFSIEPSLASPFGGSYGTTWGSLGSRVNEPAMRHAGRLFREQQTKGVSEPDKEREPLVVKQVQDDGGQIVNVVMGQSTLPQTIFNSVNVLVGVGILALPLSMRYAGWIPGLIFLFFSAWSTSYTAKLLAKCADVDSSLITFADLAYVSFGPIARVITSILFCIELVGACVALVVLFADSLDALIPGWGLTEWKIVCGIILFPLSFAPLRLLSFTSILGILSCFSIVVVVIVDGLIKPHQPGSLREPAHTYLFPANWATLPIAFGLLMSPWGGHSVFPNIYRDMRHPYKYRSAVDITYAFTFTLDILMAIVGLLMFGDGVKDEVTRNIVLTPGYPAALTVIIVICVAIIPLTKIPLNLRPIVSTLEIALGLDARAMAADAAMTGLSGLTRGLLKLAVRILSIVVFVVLAILLPDFDRIMSLLGAVACFTICIILPCGFHLKLFGKELAAWQKALDWGLIIVSTALAILSTAFNCLPKDKLGL